MATWFSLFYYQFICYIGSRTKPSIIFLHFYNLSRETLRQEYFSPYSLFVLTLLESWVLLPLPKAGGLLFNLLPRKILELSLALRHVKAKLLLIRERLVPFIPGFYWRFFFCLYLVFSETEWLFISVFSSFSHNDLQIISVLITAVEWFTTVIFRNWKATPVVIYFILFSL